MIALLFRSVYLLDDVADYFDVSDNLIPHVFYRKLQIHVCVLLLVFHPGLYYLSH